MSELYPVFFATAALLVLSGVEILFVAVLNPRWWKIRRIRTGSFLLPACGVVSIIIWTLGIFSFKKTIMLIGSAVTALILVLILALLLSLPITGIFNVIHDFLEKRARRSGGDRETPAEPTSPGKITRRSLLKAAAAVAPVVALSSAVSGVAHAFTDVRVYKRQIIIPNLPVDLDGLKILHVTDIHLGYYVWLEDIERMLEKAKPFAPDLLMLTGDLSDRLDIYDDLLRLLYSLRPPMGTYASLGNHEYYRGIRSVRRSYDRSPIPLLVNEGLTIKRGEATLYIGGADDTGALPGPDQRFFRSAVEQTLSYAPSEAFSILLGHRPTIFDSAAVAGVGLTLSGHTHGGQVGASGRSIFELVLTDRYLWGDYRKGSGRLFTSAGVGHWFPFRLGCPAEAPVLELRREM